MMQYHARKIKRKNRKQKQRVKMVPPLAEKGYRTHEEVDYVQNDLKLPRELDDKHAII